MSAATAVDLRTKRTVERWIPDLRLGVQNLLVHRLRTLLTMLGMIFGVAAVVSMLSIGAGARQKVMAVIEQMGVHNLIVEAKETMDWQAHQKIRQTSPGLTFQDYRVILDNVGNLAASTPRQRYTPTKTIPKAQEDIPAVYGVTPDYAMIGALHVTDGAFFDEQQEKAGAPVCVLGTGAKTSLFGPAEPVSQYVKLDEQWFRVIGVVAPQVTAQSDVAGVPAQDLNNIIYVPLNTSMFRLENSYSDRKDEIDGIYLNLKDTSELASS